VGKQSPLDAAHRAALTLTAELLVLRQLSEPGFPLRLPVGPVTVEEFQPVVDRVTEWLGKFEGLYREGRKQLVAARARLPYRPRPTALGETGVFFHDIVPKVAKRALFVARWCKITADDLPLYQGRIVDCIPEMGALEGLSADLQGEYGDASGVLERKKRPPVAPPDGPGRVGEFHWRGVTVKMEPQPWHLVKFLWGCKDHRAEIHAAADGAWATPDVSDTAIAAAASRASTAFTEARLAISVSVKNGTVALLGVD